MARADAAAEVALTCIKTLVLILVLYSLRLGDQSSCYFDMFLFPAFSSTSTWRAGISMKRFREHKEAFLSSWKGLKMGDWYFFYTRLDIKVRYLVGMQGICSTGHDIYNWVENTHRQ